MILMVHEIRWIFTIQTGDFTRKKPKELEEVWSALRDASDDMMRISGRDGPGPAGGFSQTVHYEPFIFWGYFMVLQFLES